MKLVVLDTESFFDREFSLKRLSTEQYVRDPQFKLHLFSMWLPDQMPDGPRDFLPTLLQHDAELRRTIETSAMLCHHAHFDLLALNHWYGLKPAFIFDTLPMARLVLPQLKSHSLESLADYFGLGGKSVPYNEFMGVRDVQGDLYAKLAEGCNRDAWLTHEIFKRLLPYVPKEELRCIDSTVRMFTEPVLRLDRPRLEQFLKDEKLRKARAMVAARAALGLPMPTTADGMRASLDQVETELQSSGKFKTALEALGYPCPMKWSEKQGCDIPALAKTDDGMKELLEHEDSRVQALAAARLGVKSTISETRAQRLLDSESRGALPVYLRYAAAKTLRFGGGDKCLTADTVVTVLEPVIGLTQKLIVDILPDDLVWDGEDFVEHDGVVFQGYREVIEYDGIKGTPDHPVCVEGETIRLAEAMRRGAQLLDCPAPTSRDVDRARSRTED